MGADKQMEAYGLDSSWVSLLATPRHRSVVCEDCEVTPQNAPGPGWRRKGTNPATWKHLCPNCVAARAERKQVR
jgi:hypothetical protein